VQSLSDRVVTAVMQLEAHINAVNTVADPVQKQKSLETIEKIRKYVV
jgi:hypothetical protein